MRFKFTGDYTNGHTSVSVHGVKFVEREPVTVENEDLIAKLKSHPEVEAVTGKSAKGETVVE